MGKSSTTKASETKRTLKYLAVAPNQKVLKQVLHDAPDAVVKRISDVALNALKGPVDLTTKQRKLFSKNRAVITELAQRGVGLKRKRKLLQQNGGFAWIPALIGGIAGILGGKLFDRS
jgi:hypothetical protein